MMDLESAIRHCEEVAKIKHNRLIRGDFEDGSYGEEECQKCADEHRQLAEWLKELKAYKVGESSSEIPNTCGDAISRQAVLEKAINVPIAKVVTEDKVIYRKIVFADDIEALPSVTPQPIECEERKSGNCPFYAN